VHAVFIHTEHYILTYYYRCILVCLVGARRFSRRIIAVHMMMKRLHIPSHGVQWHTPRCKHRPTSRYNAEQRFVCIRNRISRGWLVLTGRRPISEWINATGTNRDRSTDRQTDRITERVMDGGARDVGCGS